jgi:hypothetical protein
MRKSVRFAILFGAALVACDPANAMDDLPITGDVPVDAVDAVDAPDLADVPLAHGCCRVDGDCIADGGGARTCAFRAWADPGEPGACKTTPPTGQCWDDGDCLVGQGCKGSSFCPCDQACGAPEALGTCKPLAGVGESCGSEGANCQPGLACCYPCGQGGCDYQCAEPCDAAQPSCTDGCMAYP